MREKKIKLLHLIETGGPGGAESVYLSLAQELPKRGMEVHNILLKDGWLAGKIRAISSHCEIIPSKGSLDVVFVKQLMNYIRENEINIVHSHLFDANFYAALAAHFCQIPHIGTEHGDVHHHDKSGSRFEKIKVKTKLKILKHTKSVIVSVSKFTLEHLQHLISLPEERTPIVYNGIDGNRFKISRPKMTRIRRELGIAENELFIGTVGNLYPVKGQKYLLHAFHQTASNHPDVHLGLVGRGRLLDELKETTRQLQVPEKVHFLGFREDIPELLAAMDVFVLPSLSEGMPVSILEAMASRTPIIASEVGGIGEMITHNKNGLLVPPRNVEKLAESLHLLVSDPALRKDLAAAAYETFTARFEVGEMIRQYQRLYNLMLIH